jgi:hypothetical protein
VVDNRSTNVAGGVFLSTPGHILNTIFSGNSSYAIYESGQGLDPVVENCLFFQNDEGVYFNEGIAGVALAEGPDGINTVLTTAHGNLDADPAFVNPNQGDYRLLLSSPGIDAGVGGFAPGVDLLGNPTPYDVPGQGADGTGEEYDIGAYENDGSYGLPQIVVLSPNGGQTWIPGRTYQIRWKAIGVEGDVRLILRNGDTGEVIRWSKPASKGFTWWTVPQDQPLGTDYVIRIKSLSDRSVFDDSDAPFRIASTQGHIRVTNLNGGETW